MNSIHNFYERYRKSILFNKNIIIAGTISLIAGTIFTQFYDQYYNNNASNSLFTLIVGYIIYIPIFVILFYKDNKSNYLDPITKEKDIKKIKTDVRKLITAFSFSELIFILSKTYAHYYLLEINYEPFISYIIAELIATIIYFISINTGIKLVKLFKN